MQAACPPSSPSPSPSRAASWAIGVDLGGTKIEAIVLAPGGSCRWRERMATPVGDYDATLRAIAALVQRAEADLGLSQLVPSPSGPSHCTVGVGMPGVASATGLIKNANSTWLIGRPLASDLAAVLGRPVRIANDADCLALSEATDGAAAGATSVFAAILGTGVGAGIVVNGHLLVGPNGTAGEWGHNPLPWPRPDELPGPACYCGKQGCIETWLSGPAIARDHALHTGLRLDAREIAAGATQGDAACIATLARHAERTARGLAHVINLLDPEVIVLGGGVSRLDRLLVDVPRAWGRFVFNAGAAEPVRTRLVQSRHGDSSGVRGAAWLWREAAARDRVASSP